MVAARHQGAAHSVEIKATDVAAAATSLSNASATLHVEHSVSMFPELVELARDAGLPEGRTRFLIRTMAGVAAVATAPTALAAGLALTQLVAGDSTLWALCEGAIGAATRVSDGASQQGPADSVRDWALKSSALLTLREFFGEIWNSFVPGVTEILEGLKKGVLLESGRSFGRLAVDFFEEFATRVRRCIRERSFAPLWGETWDPDGWIADVRAMIRWFPLLTTPANSPADQKKQFELAHACGLPRYWNETISLGAYHASLQVLLVRGEQIYKGLISAKKHSAHLAKVLEELRAFLLEVETQIGGSCHRFVPFAVFFHGVAGGGKTEMAKELATVIGKDMGYDCGPLMTY